MLVVDIKAGTRLVYVVRKNKTLESEINQYKLLNDFEIVFYFFASRFECVNVNVSSKHLYVGHV